ncbi:hypothetical protein RJ55_03341 [Drechmeria coniospora]|nr:hypothetical protein RJ55_03341 [Drechmeria coniospora]
MAPTYTMSAHLCKQVYASWCQSRQPSSSSSAAASSTSTAAAAAPTTSTPADGFLLLRRHRSPSPALSEGKRSMDSERSRRGSSTSHHDP